MPDDQRRLPPEHFLSLIRQRQRGRLKIYLGFAAGVGKTYEMLQEGQRLKRQGVDVVIGMIETHGRAETAAQIGDLEQVPRRKIEYRGVVLEEMDVDAILTRRPAVALVDELAHTNAPGSRNAKRYQDVEDLLRAGINVISTLNIQHLESLYDLVEKATSVKVKERVPDYVLGLADQLVNVDLSAEDLRERLVAGKIYPEERVQRSLENFFTQANLTRLREFALEEIAHRLDRRRSDNEEGNMPSGSARVMVCLSSRGPGVEHVLRKGSRLADRLSAPWYAVYIETPREDLTRIATATQRHINNNLELVQKLGGIPMKFKGTDVVSTIAAFAKEYGISHVVLGRTRRPWYHRWFGQSVLDRLLHALPEADVIVAGAAAAGSSD
ncbi:MAG: histidine kinase [Planctomycetes bacterium]|nr:histidine kinase [Planctomycetota bacterium]